jgi:hypothetical protein
MNKKKLLEIVKNQRYFLGYADSAAKNIISLSDNKINTVY